MGRDAKRVREIAREEIASFAGLVLGRLGRLELEQGEARTSVEFTDLAAIFGEVLRDFGATELEPGPDV